MAVRRTGLVRARQAAGFTQETFAEAMGVDRSAVVRWEGGTRRPSPHQRPRMSGLLAITTGALDDLLHPPPGDIASTPPSGGSGSLPIAMFHADAPSLQEEADRLGLATVGCADHLPDGGDDVLRRELLAGVLGVAGAALIGPSRADAQALSRVPATVNGLRRLVESVQSDYLACRYSRLAAGLPEVVRYAHALRASVDSASHARVDGLMATAYRHATWLALRLGEDGLAAGLSNQSLSIAQASGDPLVEAEAAQLGAVVLRRFDQTDQAQRLVLDTAGRLDSTGLVEPGHTAAYAMLLETGAYTAAIAGRRDTALDLHAEASLAVCTIGGAQPVTLTPSWIDSRHLGLYEISVHRKLGDFGTSIEAARAIRPGSITVTERLVRYWEDVALTFGAWGKREQAFHALLAAERAAPEEVRLRPWARDLTRRLRSSGPRLPGLTEFAARAAIT
ncbi:hypothetical protein GCM10022243_58100 [Saccharothrix violaceirubra]|uniref:Transcriptional regulator with XRE-family HTH domain n=1 Tax=Saccharothrix violaceirubra TaxID=413306 RepID=A0A7W7T392_9PSEU|nr:helix-turn-helix transcriptional regulator [Saccharothrix violaceirubra]MBB4965759.1 transcriptional regulator with XRE-family HTH domain [Saccharothrix violaceirubra]